MSPIRAELTPKPLSSFQEPPLIAERYERKSIALTANQPFSEWHQVFAEPAMTVAAIDRLVHHATILELNVDSYRRKSAERAKEKSARKKTATTTNDS